MDKTIKELKRVVSRAEELGFVNDNNLKLSDVFPKISSNTAKVAVKLRDSSIDKLQSIEQPERSVVKKKARSSYKRNP